MKSKLRNITFTTAIISLVLTASHSYADLVAYWKLDEAKYNFIANDNSGNGNDGILQGGITIAPGRNGNSLHLDGIDDYISVQGLNLNTNTVTISAWIKRHGNQGKAGILFCRDGSTRAGFSFNTGNKLRYTWNHDSSRTHSWDSGLVVPEGQWVHVALVLEPRKATLYLNQNGEITSATNLLSHAKENFTGITCIGRDPVHAGGSRYFRGLVAELAVFDRAFSPVEIRRLYREGMPISPKMQPLIEAATKAKAMIQDRSAPAAVAFLENTIAEGERRRKGDPDREQNKNLLFSELYLLLATAKESAEMSGEVVVLAYEQSLSRPQKPSNYVVALLGLYQNIPADNYIDIVKRCMQKNKDILDQTYKITEFFAATGKWSAFLSFLDALSSQIHESDAVAACANSVVDALGEGNWEYRLPDHYQDRADLTEFDIKLCDILCQRCINRKAFAKAVEMYRHLATQCASISKKEFDFKVCECLLDDGQREKAVKELDRFISNFKTTNRWLVARAFALRGQAYVLQEEIEPALDTFFTLMIEYPESLPAIEANYFLGYCQMMHGDFEEATNSFTILIKEHPESAYAEKARKFLAQVKHMQP